MIKTVFLASVLGIFMAVAGAQTTPLTEPLAEEKEITITCELTEAPKHTDVVVFDSAKQGEAAKGVYHYKLWLPQGYLAEPQKRWPCMFIMSPGGNAVMGKMAGCQTPRRDDHGQYRQQQEGDGENRGRTEPLALSRF